MSLQQRIDDDVCSEVSSLPDDKALSSYVSRPLRFAGRPAMSRGQKFCTCLFYGQVAFQILAGAGLWMSRNVTPADDASDCPVGFVFQEELYSGCVSDSLAARIRECQAGVQENTTAHVDSSLYTGRRLAKDKGSHKSNRLWAIVVRHRDLPVTTLLFAAGLCALLLVSLAVAAACVTYTMFAVSSLLLLYGFYLSHNWVLLVVLVISAALAFWRRADIQATINAMRVGAEAVKATPAVLLISAGLHLVWFIYALVFVWFTTFSTTGSYDLDKECNPNVPSSWTGLYITCCPILFVLTTLFFRHCILAVCSLAVGAWCFREEAEAQGVSTAAAAELGLQYAFTTSCGSVFAASCILTVVETLRKKATDNSVCSILSWCDPLTLLVRVLWCALESCLGALTRFALIGHMFQGEGLCHVANITGDLLKRRLPGVLTCGIVAEMITEQLGWMTATAIGFFIWWYLDAVENFGFFGSIQSIAKDDKDGPQETQLILVLLTLVMVWCVRHPILSLLGVYVLSGFDSYEGGWNIFLISVALASFVAVIFNYFACVLEFATDTALYCTVLQAESGQQRNVQLKDLHQLALDLQEKKAQNEDQDFA